MKINFETSSGPIEISAGERGVTRGSMAVVLGEGIFSMTLWLSADQAIEMGEALIRAAHWVQRDMELPK